MAISTCTSVLESAMQLSDTERARVAVELLDSLPGPSLRTSQEINELLARRLADLKSGRIVSISSAEAWQMIEADE